MNTLNTTTHTLLDDKQTAATELVAVLVAVTNGQARVLTTHQGQSLPAGVLSPLHRSLQKGVRVWVEEQTAQPLGYLEQLYTFVDTQRGQAAKQLWLSVSYVGLVTEVASANLNLQAKWMDWYAFFPWEDRRVVQVERDKAILEALTAWIEASADLETQQFRQQRVDMYWGQGEWSWSEELALQRYELMYETGMLQESAEPNAALLPYTGIAMQGDHRRIFATAISRLRAKIKYRPVVFELMPEEFSLLQLQQTVEALAGRGLHKQNFRRMIEQQALVEETGQMTAVGAGRPAKLFRFRRNVMLERAIAGNKLPLARSH